MSRFLAFVWVYALPFPVSVIMFFVWSSWSGSRPFALFVLLLPLLYGYIGPGIATNVLGKWRFKGPWLIGNYYLHHGVMYAANMMPLLLLAFLGTPHTVPSRPTVIRILLCTGGLHGFVLWLHDILILRCKMVEINCMPGFRDRSPEEIATRYAPASFFSIGLTYAVAALAAFRVIVVDGATGTRTFLVLLIGGLVLMLTVPSIVFFFTERPGD